MKAPKYLQRHSQFHQEDYEYLKTKGYTHPEIKALWDRDQREGKAPVTVNKYKVDWGMENMKLKVKGPFQKPEITLSSFTKD